MHYSSSTFKLLCLEGGWYVPDQHQVYPQILVWHMHQSLHALHQIQTWKLLYENWLVQNKISFVRKKRVSSNFKI